ncbi:hypothetical protein PanWU01x14_048940 [Parasponia andersonii]|uniref:Uncharacterized protein n=1 Tax=Parasponia andersonii TaxID=3476 RepID=A0A2P5DMI0_PARAD|nr:hypothetical protein PanWU01x14_048940 [Parasponia andersonii]
MSMILILSQTIRSSSSPPLRFSHAQNRYTIFCPPSPTRRHVLTDQRHQETKSSFMLFDLSSLGFDLGLKLGFPFLDIHNISI